MKYLHFRFCDDLAILLKHREEASSLKEEVSHFLEEHLHLHLHPEKQQVASLDGGFAFLGFHFDRRGRFPSPEAQDRLSMKLAEAGNSIEEKQVIQKFEAYYGKGSAEKMEAEESSKEDPRPTPEDSNGSVPIVEVLVKLFSGNPGLYGRAYQAENRYGYAPVSSPMGEREILLHLMGKETLGIYPLWQSHVKCSCLDLDLEKRVMDIKDSQRGVFSIYQDQILQEARRIESYLKGRGIHPLLEKSGHKGYHLWVFFEEWLMIEDHYWFWKQTLKARGPFASGITVEILPRERKSTIKKGTLIKLPLSLHPVSGERSMFIDEGGAEISNPLELLEKVKRVSKDQVKSVMGSEIEQISDHSPLSQICRQ